MRLICIGCSHGRHSQLVLPEGDTLIHTGDFSRRGDKWDAISFLEWFQSQPHRHKIFVAGNHDRVSFTDPLNFESLVRDYAPSCYYLKDSGVTLDGLHFWGSPWTPLFNNWYWMSPRGPQMAAHWDLIPTDTHVLITHGPAYGHLDMVLEEHAEGRDRHQGCHDLRATIDGRLNSLRLHTFSHLHMQFCSTEIDGGMTYTNAAVVDDNYQVRGPIQVVQL